MAVRVEIGHYSIAYFDHVQTTVTQNFRKERGSYALRRLTRYSCIFAAHMNPALNGSVVIQCFKRGNVVEMCNRIMFDFYLGLPHTASNSVYRL